MTKVWSPFSPRRTWTLAKLWMAIRDAPEVRPAKKTNL